MAVGAGSIKRASKLNAEAESKKTVLANADEQVASVVEKALEQQKAAEAAAEQKTARKPRTRKTATEKNETAEPKKTRTRSATKKAPAKAEVETAEVKAPEVESAEETAQVVPAEVIVTSPEVLAVFAEPATKKNDKNKACHLTEDMPIHLL